VDGFSRTLWRFRGPSKSRLRLWNAIAVGLMNSRLILGLRASFDNENGFAADDGFAEFGEFAEATRAVRWKREIDFESGARWPVLSRRDEAAALLTMP